MLAVFIGKGVTSLAMPDDITVTATGVSAAAD